MSRATLLKTKILVPLAVVIVAAAGFGGWAIMDHDSGKNVAAVVPTRPHTTNVTYQGRNGVDALTLLEKYASVQTKHYSFGDQVTSINGVAGNGPKYWTFYVNGKESSVGAGSYVTKSTDTLSWKLQ